MGLGNYIFFFAAGKTRYQNTDPFVLIITFQARFQHFEMTIIDILKLNILIHVLKL